MKIIIGKEYPQIVLPLIDNTKTNIDILMYHWGYYSFIPGNDIQKINFAIKSAAARGVSIRVLLHSGNPSDNLRHKNADTFNHLKSWGVSAKFYKKGGTLHSKLLLIDKTYAVVGSHNFSKQSMSSNIETSVLLEGSGDIRPLCDYFNLLWGQN